MLIHPARSTTADAAKFIRQPGAFALQRSRNVAPKRTARY
jgi:hypothetical protein